MALDTFSCAFWTLSVWVFDHVCFRLVNIEFVYVYGYKFLVIYISNYLFIYLLGREISCCTYLYINWLILVCALIWDRTCNLGVLGWCSDQLSYLDGAQICFANKFPSLWIPICFLNGVLLIFIHLSILSFICSKKSLYTGHIMFLHGFF